MVMDLSVPLPTDKDIPPVGPLLKSPHHLISEWRRQLQLYPGRLRWKNPFHVSECWGDDGENLPVSHPHVFFVTPRGWWGRVKAQVGYSLSTGQQADLALFNRVMRKLSLTPTKVEEVKKKAKAPPGVETSWQWQMIFSFLGDERMLISFLREWEMDLLTTWELEMVLMKTPWVEAVKQVKLSSTLPSDPSEPSFGQESHLTWFPSSLLPGLSASEEEV